MYSASNVWMLSVIRGEAAFSQEWILLSVSNCVYRLLNISYNILEKYMPNEKIAFKRLVKYFIYILIE
jgi:hypothetical protein